MNKTFSNTVWFIESRYTEKASEVPTMGSGVVVWLKTKGDDSDPKKYLLTCSHVVRGGTQTGPLQTKIACWPTGNSYIKVETYAEWPTAPKDGTWTATVFDVLNRPTTDIDANEVSPGDDWILLDVDDPDFQEYPSISAWGELRKGNRITIVGYPGGASHWITGTPVEPYQASGFRAGRSSDSPGTLKLEGEDRTAPGMSGGGVFEPNGKLVGLHRAQNQQTLEFGAVKASHIQSMLSARGFELVPDKRNSEGEGEGNGSLFIVLALTLLAILIAAIIYFYPSPSEVKSEAVGLGRDFADFQALWNSEDPREKPRISEKLKKHSVTIDWDDLAIVRTEPTAGEGGSYFVGSEDEEPEIRIPLNENFHESAAVNHRTLDNVRGQLIVNNEKNPPELTVVLTKAERPELIEYDPITFDQFQQLMRPTSEMQSQLSDFKGVYVSNWRIPTSPSHVKPLGQGIQQFEIAHPANETSAPAKWSFIYIIVDRDREISLGSLASGIIIDSTGRSAKIKAHSIRN